MSNHNPFLKEEYQSRINRVMDFVEDHLDQELSVERLAQIANFSSFHFHRIFRAMVGEPLMQFILRLRLEKAATQLLYHPKKSITEIALDCGFSSSATFARAFKDKFQCTASTYRNQEFDQNSKNRKTDRKFDQASGNWRKAPKTYSIYLAGEFFHQKWNIMVDNKIKAQVEVKTLPEITVAYVRHVGPYKGNEKLFEGLFEKIMRWAGPRGLIKFPETMMMSIYHDNPDITDEEKLRISVGISVPKNTEVDGEIGKMILPAGEYAIARFEIDADEYESAWDAVYGGWLPESGYQPADSPCFEWYHNDPKQHPEGKHVLDICIPVKPL